MRACPRVGKVLELEQGYVGSAGKARADKFPMACTNLIFERKRHSFAVSRRQVHRNQQLQRLEALAAIGLWLRLAT